VRGGLRVLALTLAMGVAAVGCSGEDASVGEDAEGGTGGAEETTVEDGLGHQAYQPSTRLVVPAGKGEPFDRVARVLAGLSEGPLGARIFVYGSPGDGGISAWRDVADEEADGHQLAYVTEELLATGRGGVGPEDFEMAAMTDVGCAVLVVKEDPEIETLQYDDFEVFGDFVAAAEEDPGFLEVADAGEGTVYRAGTLALEREAGVDLSPKTPAGKEPVQAIYDADVEAALVGLDEEVLTEVWAGELRPLVVMREERCPDLPDVPTAKESGYDVSVPVFGGIAAPAGTPQNVVDELGRAFVGSSSSRGFGEALVGMGREPAQMGSEEFARYVEERSRLLPEDTSGAGNQE
jgi:tripartite-type tricarboxylate transporter receptor subunit TctC